MRTYASGADSTIRQKLFFYLTIFIIFTLTIIWIFQVKLLGTFYANIKRRELERAADNIENHINDSGLQTEVYQNAVDYSLCVKILRIEGTTAAELVSVDVSGNSVLYNITDKYMSELYYKARDAGGEYIEMRTKGELRDAGMYYSGYYYSSGKGSIVRNDGNVESTILIRLVTGEDGKLYAIMLNAEMTPVGAIVSMLSLQYLWIMAVLVIGAILLAFIISKNISKPIEKMNRAARKLAQGNYDVNFSGEGFSETRDLADTLNYAARELSKTDRIQKELIANISHDLRTPLTMISGYGEVMRDIPGENTPENVQVIIDESNRLCELVNDLLDLSKLQAGAGMPDRNRFNLTETVRQTMQRYEKLTARDGVRIEFYSKGDVFVNADRKMILQVLYNLINNAINYTGADKLVRLDQTVNGDLVRISVTDTGEGISPEQLPLIWERYYKVDKVHRRAMVGTGIGLSIVKGVLELHGAHYGVDSTPKEGSTFWFELRTTTGETDERE